MTTRFEAKPPIAAPASERATAGALDRDEPSNSAMQAAPGTSQPQTASATDRARIAEALETHRHELALGFLDSVANWEKYAAPIAACNGKLDDYAKREFHVLVDYLALLFRSGDLTYRHLYVGEKVKQAYWERESTADQQHQRRVEILSRDHDALTRVLRKDLSTVQWQALAAELDAIQSIVWARAKQTLEVLMVGDCLFLDVTAFLVGPALEDGVSINPTFLTSKNPAELRNDLRKLADRKFDLVFYSPFTYEFAPEYARLMDWRLGASFSAKILALAEAATENAAATIELLGDLFECNVFIHNSANVRRHDSSLGERLKNVATWRARRVARQQVNARIEQLIAQRNSATFEHLFVLDEAALLARHSEAELGRLFYDSDIQHPAALGKWMADLYRDVIAVHALLLKKKLVICDLDNTLWKGVIGEGSVAHYGDKQRILKRLQAKGVVLAINSKNDPKNVRWEGGVLCAEDFVCAQINWDNKVSNIKRIAQTLNLKTKDFVFIDDREDEREMVNIALPEVRTLDALADRSWRLLDLWSRYLGSAGESDRTQFYRQKEQRDNFVQSLSATVEDQGALFQKLGLAVTIRDARKSDLKRVAELINRTNQFNTCGSRTTARQAAEWLAAGDRRILVVDCGDKFGSMGTICIAVVHEKPTETEIPVFVLSCRVFGYGIETVVVNAVKRLARRRGVRVVGAFQETPHNEPCRKVYPQNGFIWSGSAWIYDGGGAIGDPTWLKVQVEDPALAN